MTETHPYYNVSEPENNGLRGGFLPIDSIILIIGTFPPPRTDEEKALYFFYDSPLNQF